ncbi:MAG: ribosome silencing factor [Rhodospirillales bacterium]
MTLAKSDGMRSLVTASLDDDKAEDIVVIDLAGKTTIADYMIVASGTSSRHIGAMADHLIEKIKTQGEVRATVEGAGQSDWVLIDAGDVVVHLFRPEVRAFYAIERLWGTPQAFAERSFIDGRIPAA